MLELQPDYEFDQLSINCVPLTGLNYKTDERKVHQLIHGFVQDETAKTRINPKGKRQYGLLDYLALLSHCRGKGNKTVRIEETEALQTSLI